MTTVLLLEGRPRMAQHVLNCLSEAGYRVHMVSRHSKSYMRLSRRLESYRYAVDEGAFLDAIESLLQAEQIDVLLPIFDTDIEFVMKHRDRLERLTTLAVMPELRSYSIAENKSLMSSYAEAHRVNAPKTLRVEDADSFMRAARDFDFPALLKIAEGCGGSGIYRLLSYSELEAMVKANPDMLEPGRYILQSYVDGWDIDVNVLCREGRCLALSVQKALVPASGYAMAEAIEFVEDPEAEAFVRDLFAELNWSGVAHIDLRFDVQEQNYKLIEVNPRIWGTIYGSVLGAGINFPDLLIQLSCGREIEDHLPRSGYFVFLEFFLKSKLKNVAYPNRMKPVLKNTDFKWFLRDPIPQLVQQVQACRARLSKCFA